MIPEKSLAFNALAKASTLMDYEMLVSRPGMSEPDSHFVWASTFRAPIGVSFIRENVYFNLFLPGGSENETDKKLFLNRVGAKFKDDAWQVSRSMEQMNGIYGNALKLAVSNYRSVILDNAYIKNGRTYAHLIFNSADIGNISRGLLANYGRGDGLRIEHLKATAGKKLIFSASGQDEKVMAVTVEVTGNGQNTSKETRETGTTFIMGNILENGVKSICNKDGGRPPAVLLPEEIEEISDSMFRFSSKNSFVVNLVEFLAEENVVVYGYYGTASGNSFTLSINIPSQQRAALFRTLGRLNEMEGQWKVVLKEVICFKDTSETPQDVFE